MCKLISKFDQLVPTHCLIRGKPIIKILMKPQLWLICVCVYMNLIVSDHVMLISINVTYEPWDNTYNTISYVFFFEGEFRRHLFTWRRWTLALQHEVVVPTTITSKRSPSQVVDLPNSQNSPIGHHSTLHSGWQLSTNVPIVYIELALAFQNKWTIFFKKLLV